MKSPWLALGIVLAITLPSCALRKTVRSDAPRENAAASGSVEQQRKEAVTRYAAALTNQDRVNRYLHREVVPRLKVCWARLEGNGTIVILAPYRRYGDVWVAGSPDIRRSTLPKGQDDLALRCFQEAVRDTSLPVEEDDGDAEELRVNWSFPVPWPRDIKEVAMRMATDPGGGGGGCGPEAPPSCQDCYTFPLIVFSLCVPTCVGYLDCLPNEDFNGCRMKTLCVTVSPFGNQGGLVIY